MLKLPIVSGIITRDLLASYWPMFSPVPGNSPTSLCKIKEAWFPIHFLSGEERHQCCQLSRIIRETPDFEPFLPVSRLESEISRTVAEVCYFL